MTLPDWVIPSILIAIIGFLIRRYLSNQDKRNDLQDKKYDILADEIKIQGDNFISVVQELKDVISSIRVHSASQKTLSNERHKQTVNHLNRIDRHIDNLKKAQEETDKEIGKIYQGHKKNEDEIRRIRDKIGRDGYRISKEN